MVTQRRVFPVWVLLLAASLLAQNSVVSGAYSDPPLYKLWPGTHREFEHYKCTGEFHKANREHYSVLRKVCEDCTNVFRDNSQILPECMSNCFDNYTFLFCVKHTLRSDRLKDYLESRDEITV
ncbi:molt-inhibiting hormone-like isoform X3 [Eriocheir sinensis]|uniref:molt-inhibiting hormone-like n=1 Tax=Eriocheir sinensis TaxID=95602 RepID=UPI0021CA7E3D|nr:molt-inhibiting hormone-like [Eriocheir sinensis]XP_050694766.1 molt-inhibiting hormone-like isoform X1 [Eriocheir sinensis]XP_050694767.1 molt-inhibiting hormone-like isoform X2 [Eriocheir sinensis]XP_050694768.1 molt-inhibiting hormone-like isoform X3 [Eriocheir sinensis]XP_050694769.1 molt-inhibiting hormone-like isoform X3 [Eriocheir sinensis]